MMNGKMDFQSYWCDEIYGEVCYAIEKRAEGASYVYVSRKAFYLILNQTTLQLWCLHELYIGYTVHIPVYLLLIN